MTERRLRPPSITRPLLALAALLVLAIIGVTIHQLDDGRRNVLRNADRQISQLDEIFAEQIGREMRMIDQAFSGAAAARGAGQDADSVDAALRGRLGTLPQVADAGVTDLDGNLPARGAEPATRAPEPVLRLLAASLDAGTEAADPARRDSTVNDAAAMRPGGSGRLHVGGLVRGADGKSRAYVVRVFVDARGQPAGAAYAALNLAFFEEACRVMNLAESAAVLLLHRDGTVLMRTPPVDGVVGRRYANQAALDRALATDGVTLITLNSPIDHSARLVALRPLPDYSLVVTVSVSKQATLAIWTRAAEVFTLVAVAACAAITLLVMVLAARSRQLDIMFQDLRAAKETADAANRVLRSQMAEREHAEAALREAQRAEAIGQLTRGVAHDFNNLLAVVLGNIDLMSMTHRNDPAALKRLDTMRVAAERGAMLTGQLMAFARRQPLQPRAVDLNEVAGNMQPLLASAVGSRIRVVLQLAPDLPFAQVDPTQIELAILNLAINARDAMTKGGVLTIFTAPTQLLPTEPGAIPAGVALSVRDSGPGMTADVRAKAFEPFFTTKGPGQGSGLGLSQVHGLAYQSGGSVELHSAPGEGTCVEIRLPLAADQPAALTPPPAPIAAPQAAPRVLLVDDDDAVRETAAAVLRAQAYTVTDVREAAAALALLRGEQGFDVLVTDVVMPGMSGPELIREVRGFAPALPIVMISGYAEPGELAASGMPRFFVRKPFTPEALSGAIKAAISGHAAPVAPMAHVTAAAAQA